MAGFIHAEGKRLADAEGRELLLRGVGLGGWLLPEGYMWCFPEQGDRPRKIERMVGKLLGRGGAEKFWNEYRARYIAREDIRRIAEEGFNSVRLPLNARHLLASDGSGSFDPEGIALVDRLIGWCREAGICVILDMHAAPGGQTGANIDDSPNDRPELFTQPANRRRLAELWRALALRYRGEPAVAGYDLLNEPLPSWFSQYNALLLPLYRELAAAVRSVDKNHLLILEGAHWATDWSVFTQKPDDNLLLEFHKYWNNPDAESLEPYLAKREEWDVPVFMGEGGENNTDWYAGAFRLLEDLDISWNFWTWKKMDCTNSPCSVKRPEEWGRLVDYLRGDETAEEQAKEALRRYLENLPIGRCDYRPSVPCALFRRVPVRIPAVFYDYTGAESGFHAAPRPRMEIDFRKSDAVDIRFSAENGSLNFAHGKGEAWSGEEWLCARLSAGEWLRYTLEGREENARARLTLRARAAEGKTARVSAELDGVPCASLQITGPQFDSITADSPVSLPRGPHFLVLKAVSGSVEIQSLTLAPVPQSEGRR